LGCIESVWSRSTGFFALLFTGVELQTGLRSTLTCFSGL